MIRDEYRRPGAHPCLEPGAIHVWRARLDVAREALSARALTLSADEKKRAARFHFARDRERYVAARGMLRRLLSCYIGVAPTEIAFRYGPRGKPAIEPPATSAADAIEFNVAHSGELALFVFARDRCVGVDVELLRAVPDALAIARNHFTLAEERLLQDAAPAARSDCFFRLWTRKESVIKAIGTGLSLPLTEFDVSAGAADGAVEAAAAAGTIVSTDNNGWHIIRLRSQPDAAWAVRDLASEAGYHAALAVAGEPGEVQLWRADDDR